MIANIVYILCALTSGICAWLLFRGWKASGTKLLFWGALCFAGLLLNNVLLVIDMRVPQVNLAGLRILPALLGVGLLLYALIRNDG